MGRSATTSGSPVRTRRQKLLWSPVAIVLVLLMAAGSVLMWIGLPLGLIWLVSALTDSSQPSMGPYLLILIGLPVGMFAIGKVLGALDRAHGHHGPHRRGPAARRLATVDARRARVPAQAALGARHGDDRVRAAGDRRRRRLVPGVRRVAAAELTAGKASGAGRRILHAWSSSASIPAPRTWA